MMDIGEFLKMQRQLQIKMKEANPTQGGDPYLMNPDQLAQFITWNYTALVVELGEMMAEVGWKPWATDRSVNATLAMHEMVDAWHFFLNILLAIHAWEGLKSPGGIGEEFTQYYMEKNAKNLQRQVDGYDGVTGKCRHCHRDLSEVHASKHWMQPSTGDVFCSQKCAES